MADLTHVQDAIVSLIGQVLYPNGTKQKAAVNAACKMYAGWPDPNTMNADMKASTAHISVFALQMSKSTPQMMAQWQALSIKDPTILLEVDGQVLTLSGSIDTPQNVVVQTRAGFVAYPVQSADTLTSIATAIATAIPGASSSGAQVTMPDGDFTANISTPAVMLREVGRNQQPFQISVWAPTPELRAAIAMLIDPALRVAQRLVMPDGTFAGIWFASQVDDDTKQKQGMYIRHIRFNSEYATTQTDDAMTIGAVVTNTEVVSSIDAEQ